MRYHVRGIHDIQVHYPAPQTISADGLGYLGSSMIIKVKRKTEISVSLHLYGRK